jgi:hypothetical protein
MIFANINSSSEYFAEDASSLVIDPCPEWSIGSPEFPAKRKMMPSERTAMMPIKIPDFLSILICIESGYFRLTGEASPKA